MKQPESHSAAAKQKAKEAQDEVADSMRDTVNETRQKVTAELSGAAEKTKAGAAREFKTLADALHTAAGELDSGSPQRRMIDTVAKNLDDFSDGIQHKNMGEMMGGLNDMARRNPMMFLGGAALLGFVATRLASASAPENRHTSGGHRDSSSSTTRGVPTAAPTPAPTRTPAQAQAPAGSTTASTSKGV